MHRFSLYRDSRWYCDLCGYHEKFANLFPCPGHHDTSAELQAASSLDLSPLAKFMGRKRKHWKSYLEYALDGSSVQSGDRLYDRGWQYVRHNGEWHTLTQDLARMYGWEIDPPAAPIPEKSPQEKALDDFIAKRKAKRTDAEAQAESAGIMTNARSAEIAEAQERALDRAMQKLSPHEVAFHERLMPYRGAVL